MLCPACGYDESIDGAPVEPVDQTPYTERYRGPRPAGVHGGRASFVRISRTRVLVAFALLAVAVLYASLMVVSDMRAREGASGPAATRMVATP